MASLKQKLSYLLMGQPGWENRLNIIELLTERPYNMNQIANELDVTYRTVKHHIDVLLEHDLITSSDSGNYGKVYFLSTQLENNMDLFEDIKNKMINITSSPELFQKVLEQTHDGIIIVDKEKDIIFVNKSAEQITGFSSKELLGNKIDFFYKDNFLEKNIKELSTDEASEIETKALKKSEEEIILRVTIDRIENHELLGYSIVFADITEHKRAQR